MKSFRTAIILVVILVLAGGAYWYYDVKRKRDKKEQKDKEALLFAKSGKKVVRLVLKAKGSEPIVMELKPGPEAKKGEITGEEPKAEEEKKDVGKRRRGKKAEEEAEEPAAEEENDEWTILSPVQTGGDKIAIEQIINSLKDAKREQVILETLEQQEEYGLKDPDFSVEFTYEGEKETRGIAFGIRSLDKKRLFSRVIGEDRVIAVATSLKDSLDKSLFDLRDKRIAPYKSEEVEQVIKVTGMESFVLAKEGESWFFSPDKTKALDSRVDLYTGYLRWGNIAEIIEEKGDLRAYPKYGLDRPRLIITMRLTDGSNYLFLLGDPVQEGDAEFYYATRSTDSMIFQVTADTAKNLAMTEFEIKDRHIFTFSAKDVVKASFKYDDQDFTVEKEGEDWKFPGAKEALSRSYSIDNTVFAVSSVEYEDIPPVKRGDREYVFTGIENPRYTITLHFNDNREPLTVKVTDKDKESSKCWMTPDDGETAYRIFGYFISNLPENKDELME